MANDIDQIVARISRTRPDVESWQLEVTHDADDDGLWFFRKRGTVPRVSLESSSGNCPFLVESDSDDTRSEAKSIDEAVSIVLRLLGP